MLPPMPILIDTYNVLQTVGVLPPELAGLDIPGLIQLLASSRYRDERATLVCDGVPKAAGETLLVVRLGSATVRYSGHGRTADDLIDQIIRASTAPRRLVVVSSDHAVLRSARKRRSKAITSQEFLQELANDAGKSTAATSPRKPKGQTSDEQVDRWVDVFKLDDQTLAIPSGRRMRPAVENEPDAPAPNENTTEPKAPPPHTIKRLRRGEGLPEDLVEQAERMWEREHKAQEPPLSDQEPPSEPRRPAV